MYFFPYVPMQIARAAKPGTLVAGMMTVPLISRTFEKPLDQDSNFPGSIFRINCLFYTQSLKGGLHGTADPCPERNERLIPVSYTGRWFKEIAHIVSPMYLYMHQCTYVNMIRDNPSYQVMPLDWGMPPSGRQSNLALKA